MSGRLVKEVLEHAPETLSSLELLVLVSVAESARDGDRETRGGSAAASIVAHRVRAHEASVRRTLARLVERGLLKPVHARAHRGQAQQYRLAELHSWHRDL